MKWKQWKQLLIVISVIIAVVIFFFREDLFRKNNFPIIERGFSYEDLITLQPLDGQQVVTMAKELIASLPKEEDQKKIIVSQAKKNNTKLTRFRSYLVNNLPNNWSVVNKGNPDYVVTGYFFHPKNNPKQASALFLFLIEWNTGKIVGATTNCTHSEITTMCEGLIENLRNFSISGAQVEVINKVQDAQDLVSASTLEQITKAQPTGITLLANDIYGDLGEKLPDKQKIPNIKANTALIIAEDSNRLILELTGKVKRESTGESTAKYEETIAIKTNYTNDKITTACKDLIENLQKKPPMLEDIESLWVAVIHKQPSTQFSAKTALTLEEMVKAKPRMRLLGRNYIEKNHTQLRKAMQGVDLSEITKNNFRSIAVLSIEEDHDGFILELIRLSDHKIMVTSVSDPRPPPDSDRLSIVFKADPQAKVYYIQNQQPIFIGRTKRVLRPQDIKELRIQDGTKFILKRNGNNTKQYIHPDDGEREDDDNMIRYTYNWE